MPGAGIDLIEIDRLERAIARRPALTKRLFTEGERAFAHSRARPGQHLAARLCAKEAVVKALGLTVMRPQEIEIVGGGFEPGLVLHGATRAQARRTGAEVAVSLTHSRSNAAAVAVLLRP